MSRALGILILVVGWAQAAGAQDAAPRTADDRAAARERIRELMAEARAYSRKSHEAFLRGSEALAKGDKDALRAAWEEMDEAGALGDVAMLQARAYGEQGGPVAEALYWQEEAKWWRIEQSREKTRGDVWQVCEDYATEAEKKAKEKMEEAQRLAETDSAVREDLRRYYAEEAARHRRLRDAARDKARALRGQGEEAKARRWSDVADREAADAHRAQTQANKYATPISTEQPDRPAQPETRPPSEQPEQPETPRTPETPAPSETPELPERPVEQPESSTSRPPKKPASSPKGSGKHKKKIRMLKDELAGMSDLTAGLRKKIVARLAALRLRDRKGNRLQNELVKKRRKKLLKRYTDIPDTIERWKEKIGKDLDKRKVMLGQGDAEAQRQKQWERAREIMEHAAKYWEAYREAAQRYADAVKRCEAEGRHRPSPAGLIEPLNRKEGCKARGLDAARAAGPVAEQEYWRTRARLESQDAEDYPEGSAERQRCEQRAKEYEDKANEKLEEAQRRAETEPWVRDHLHKYYTEQAQADQEQADALRAQGSNAEADEMDASAGKNRQEAAKYAPPAEDNEDD